MRLAEEAGLVAHVVAREPNRRSTAEGSYVAVLRLDKPGRREPFSRVATATARRSR